MQPCTENKPNKNGRIIKGPPVVPLMMWSMHKRSCKNRVFFSFSQHCFLHTSFHVKLIYCSLPVCTISWSTAANFILPHLHHKNFYSLFIITMQFFLPFPPLSICISTVLHVSSATMSPPFPSIHLHILYSSFLLSPVKCYLSPSCASSCCLQIPFNEEEIRRALIAVHNFAVPQIKVLSSFILRPTLSYSLVTLSSVFALQWLFYLHHWHEPLSSLHAFKVVTLRKEKKIIERLKVQERNLVWYSYCTTKHCNMLLTFASPLSPLIRLAKEGGPIFLPLKGQQTRSMDPFCPCHWASDPFWVATA